MKNCRPKQFAPNQIIFSILAIMLIVGCDIEKNDSFEKSQINGLKKQKNLDVYEFQGTVYDIAASPDGSIFVGLNNGRARSIEVIKNGEIKTMANIDAPTDIQGIAPLGSGNLFATTGGTDLAKNGELYRISFGNARIVADLGAFESENDPDAFEGIQWKNQLCEAIDGFSAGPQNNPYKVAARSGSTALIADAAGNTILQATTTGKVDYKAILTPPLNAAGDWMVRFNAGDEGQIPCYVQPVPTSVAVGPNGFVYIGELVGALSEEDGTFPIGLSRIWKMPAEASHLTCSGKNPDGECELLIDGLTSVIDIEIGPDGLLYVVELDENSWFSAFIPEFAAGGTVSSYDLEGNLVEIVEAGLQFPSAITFDKSGNLWLLENNNTFAVTGKNPTVRILK